MKLIPIYVDKEYDEFIKSRNALAKDLLKKGIILRPLFGSGSYGR